MSAVIFTTGLSMTFGQVRAVHDLNLSVEAGQVFGFLGPNGAGKTTTVRLLNGLLEPTAGQATVLERDIRTQSVAIRHETGVLTESPSLYEALTARQNLAFFGEMYGVPADVLPRRIDEVLDQFGLLGRADDKAGGYSRGMKQRLALARAFLHKPRLLFLDEPTAGLDPVAARAVMELIDEQARHDGRTVFLCTHNLTEAQRLCDVVGVIDHGELRAIGTPDMLARQMWQRMRVDITVEAPLSPATLGSISSVPGVTAVNVSGSQVALELSKLEAVADVVALLVSQGARIHAVVPREHTLEDIYFQLQDTANSEEARP